MDSWAGFVGTAPHGLCLAWWNFSCVGSPARCFGKGFFPAPTLWGQLEHERQRGGMGQILEEGGWKAESSPAVGLPLCCLSWLLHSPSGEEWSQLPENAMMFYWTGPKSGSLLSSVGCVLKKVEPGWGFFAAS